MGESLYGTYTERILDRLFSELRLNFITMPVAGTGKITYEFLKFIIDLIVENDPEKIIHIKKDQYHVGDTEFHFAPSAVNPKKYMLFSYNTNVVFIKTRQIKKVCKTLTDEQKAFLVLSESIFANYFNLTIRE